MEAISIKDIQAARQRLAGHAVVTPLIETPLLNELAGRRLLIKPECLQPVGAFKIRGAWSALSALDQPTLKRGVIAFSSGNHAQAVAYAAARHQTSAVIVMPDDAPTLKINNTRALGAEVLLYDRKGGEDREAIGSELAEKRGLTLIKPYDNPQVMAGQGTCGLEIAEQARAAAVEQADVLVPCGGGGLTAGIAIALESEAPAFNVLPVEPVAADDTIRSLTSGRRESVEGTPDSICDAIVTASPGELTFPIIRRLCKSGIAITDEQALRAMAVALLRLKLVAEPGGASALAAALFHADKLSADATICVISGGNTDPDMLTRATTYATEYS